MLTCIPSSLSFYDTANSRRKWKSYDTEKALGSRLRDFDKNEIECAFVPASYDSRISNLKKRRQCFMFLNSSNVHPLRLDMPDNAEALDTEFFSFDDVGDYDIVIFEANHYKEFSTRTEKRIYDELYDTQTVFLM